jgi:hypothetical protein
MFGVEWSDDTARLSELWLIRLDRVMMSLNRAMIGVR